MGEWAKGRLGTLAEILDNRRVPVREEDRPVGPVPYYGANGQQGWIDRALFDEPLILLAEDGGHFDEFAHHPIAYRIEGPSWVNNHAHVLRSAAGVDQSYLFWSLRNKNIRKWIAGGTRSKLTRGEMEQIEISLPPLTEQRRIAEILDTIDETIQATESVIAKLVKIREGLRRSQFADLVLSSELHSVSECFDMTLGKMLSPTARTGTSPSPYLANRNVQWEKCSLDNLDEMDFTQAERAKFSLEPGDVLICEGGEVGRTAIWHGELETCFFQKAIHRLRAKGQVLPEFMLHYMKYAAELDLFRMHTSQTSIAHLTGEQLARLPIPVPSKEVQATVIRDLASLSRRLEADNGELQKVCRIRSGLATDLLSGRVRTVAA